MTSHTWSQDEILQFLDVYKEEQIIWDPRHKHHKSKKKIEYAWKRLSDKMNIPVKEMKIKKDILMGTFRRHLKKKLLSERKSKDPDDIYEPIWFAYQKLASFMLPVYQDYTKKVREDVEREEEEDEEEEEVKAVPRTGEVPTIQLRPVKQEKIRPPIREVPPSDPESEVEYVEFLEPDSDASDSEHSGKDRSRSRHSSKEELSEKETYSPPEAKRKKPIGSTLVYQQSTSSNSTKLKTPVISSVHSVHASVNSAKKLDSSSYSHDTSVEAKEIVEALSLVERSGLTRKKDECDSFGEYIANSLRKHDERTRSMIKHAINNIIFEQEMKKYKSNQYNTVYMTGVEENPLMMSVHVDGEEQ